MYQAKSNRYQKMVYNRCGRSGIHLPAISLGLWHNFGGVDVFENGRNILRKAFDSGITHFDLANNYGPPYGSAEENFGKYMAQDFNPYRDELIISSKAGYDMWDGPYGNWGSRKYLMASCNQSLKRMGLDYVDIFYHHRPDPDTPLEETMTALADIVKQGKALYAGISNYPADLTKRASEYMKSQGVPLFIHQPKYSMFERWVESGLLETLEEEGIGCIAFSPLAQGLLTDKYIKGIPDDSRAAKNVGHLKRQEVNEETMNKVVQLQKIAENRNQSMAQLALAWLLKDQRITSVLIGASSVKQLEQNLKTLENLSFQNHELLEIENILN